MQQAYDENYTRRYNGCFGPLCEKLLAALLCQRNVVIQKSFPVEVDDEWGNDGADFQSEREHETGAVVCKE